MTLPLSLLLASLSLSLVAQDAPSAPKAGTPKAASGGFAPLKVEAPKPPADEVLARIGGAVVHRSDFDLFLGQMLNPQQRLQVEMVAGAKDQLRKQFLEYKLLEAKARKEKLDAGPSFLRKRALMDMQVLVEELMQKEGERLRKQIQVADADVKAFYDQNPKAFEQPATYSCRHILVSVKGGPNGEKGLSEEEAKARLAQAEAALKAGKGWDEVAKSFSDDPGSKDRGGLYEDIRDGQFQPEFEKAAKAQELGKLGVPVRTPYGFHLIQAEKRTPAKVQPFDAVKDQARQKATQARQEAVYRAFLDGLKKEIPFVEGAEAQKAAPAPAKVVRTPKAKGGRK